MLFALSSLFASSVHGQANSDCVWRHNGLELDLTAFKDKTLVYDGDDYTTTYTICTDSLECVAGDSVRYAMVESNYAGINECNAWASYNETVQPFYDYTVGSWLFNYSNGEACPDQNQQVNRTTSIAYNCNPVAETPTLVDVFAFDACNILLQMEWEGACNDPPEENEECIFKSGFQSLNLSTIKGSILGYKDENDLYWKFSPCANKMNCTSAHGSEVQVMSDIKDTYGQCIKFLGVWSGDSVPFFHRDLIGTDYWDFFWADGEECGEGGPLEILNVRYYCNPDIDGAEITSVGPSGPCQFRIEIDSNLACGNISSSATEY